MDGRGLITSDEAVVALLRQRGPLGISQMISALKVTDTAVRQRLARLMRRGLVERAAVKAMRGRPSHRYSLTERGRRQSGSNFLDLALALWSEVRQIEDPDVRRGLLQRIAKTLGRMYADQVQGSTTQDRMQSISRLFAERNVPFQVESRSELPVLTASACPYPELAEQDRSICAVEKMLFSELLGEPVKLTDYRLDGASCCRFETN